jgi:hypothetical protein
VETKRYDPLDEVKEAAAVGSFTATKNRPRPTEKFDPYEAAARQSDNQGYQPRKARVDCHSC